MKQVEKDTSSGRDIREYRCDACGYQGWEDRGTALWQILSAARKKEEAEAKPAAAKTKNCGLSKWQRFLTVFWRPPKK